VSYLKKTKIVCTIGPVTESVETLKELLNRGMNVMRLNFSHGDYEEHGTRIKNFRQAMSETGKRAGLLLDTKGPEIRTMSLEDGKDVSIKAGQKFTFTTDQSVVGNSERVAVTYPDFAKDLKVGDMILVDDGLIELDVTEIKGNEVICIARNNGELGQKKGINLPNVSVNLPALSEKDIEDLINSYKNSKIGKSLILALKGYNDTGRLLLFEKYIENFLTNLLKEKVQRMPYGPEIIFAYVHAKEVEIKNLRICLVGRANGLSADFIKERLREIYV